MGDLLKAEALAEKSWYRVGTTDIPVANDRDEVGPLTKFSPLLGGLKPIRQIRLYVRGEDKDAAEAKLKE